MSTTIVIAAIVGVLVGLLLVAVFMRSTRNVTPYTWLGKAIVRIRSVIAGGGGPDPTNP